MEKITELDLAICTEIVKSLLVKNQTLTKILSVLSADGLCAENDPKLNTFR